MESKAYALVDIRGTDDANPRLPRSLILHIFDFVDLRTQRRLACASTAFRDSLELRHGSATEKRVTFQRRKRQSAAANAFVILDTLLLVAGPLCVAASLWLACLNAEGAIVPVATISLPIVAWCGFAAVATLALLVLQCSCSVAALPDAPWRIGASHMQLPALPSVLFARELMSLSSWGTAQLAWVFVASVPGEPECILCLP